MEAVVGRAVDGAGRAVRPAGVRAGMARGGVVVARVGGVGGGGGPRGSGGGGGPRGGRGREGGAPGQGARRDGPGGFGGRDGGGRGRGDGPGRGRGRDRAEGPVGPGQRVIAELSTLEKALGKGDFA